MNSADAKQTMEDIGRRIDKLREEEVRKANLTKLTLAYLKSTTEDSERGLSPKITKQEMQILDNYGSDLGVASRDVEGIKHIVNNPNALRILRANAHSSCQCQYGATQISLEKIEKYARIALENDGIIDPEEFVLLETITELEGHKPDYFFGLLKNSNRGRRLGLIQNSGSLTKFLDFCRCRFNSSISPALQKAGFEVTPLDCNTYSSFKDTVQNGGVTVIAMDTAIGSRKLEKCAAYFKEMRKEGKVIPSIAIFARKYNPQSRNCLLYGVEYPFTPERLHVNKVSCADDHVQTMADIMQLCGKNRKAT